MIAANIMVTKGETTDESVGAPRKSPWQIITPRRIGPNANTIDFV